MSPPDLLEIHLNEDPFNSTVKTRSGAVVRGVTRIEIVQSSNEPPRALLSVELFSLQASIYADQCKGALDSDTVNVLMRLPSPVLADLAEEIRCLADDAAQIERHARGDKREKRKQVWPKNSD